MTTPKHPGADINCRSYNHHTDPLFIKLTTDYPYSMGYQKFIKNLLPHEQLSVLQEAF